MSFRAGGLGFDPGDWWWGWRGGGAGARAGAGPPRSTGLVRGWGYEVCDPQAP